MTIHDFLNIIISKIRGTPALSDSIDIDKLLANSEPEDLSPLDNEDSFEEENSSENLEERINVTKRTLMTKLYTLEQEIAIFKGDFPSEYQSFSQRIEQIKSSYNTSLEELKKLLTFEIDPENDTSKIDEVIRLEKDIKKFIESTVKFHIISNRLQRLIKKLNILYNVSIFHSKENEREKIHLQLERAMESEKKIAEEFKKSEYILLDKQLKERIIELLSYADYEIFKSSIRNLKQIPETLIDKLVMLKEFDGFNYVATFIAYIKDELSDLLEVLPRISDKEHQKLLKSKSEKLLIALNYSDNFAKTLLSTEFWNDFLSFESTLLELLKVSGVEKEKVQVNVLDRMNITIDEDDVLISPMSNANVVLINIFSTIHDERVLLMIKLFENLSNQITYREIYFLLLLFDVLEIVRNTPNDLIEHIEKYINKYPYDRRDIVKKKKDLINSSKNEYVVIFHLDDDSNEVLSTLKSLNIDFKVESNNVLINSFYFIGLENVLSNLKMNTNKIQNGGQ